MNDFRTQIYSDYGSFKNWEFGKYEADGETYQIELSRLQVNQPLRILEIGFGSGGFMTWARAQGHTVVGTEVNKAFVGEALRRGFDVYESADLQPILALGLKFDLVVVFDVVEHLFPLEIKDLLVQIKRVLEPSGRVLLRFPNSVSPFSGQSLHGDITHVTPMSVEKLMQIATPLKYQLVSQANAARPVIYGSRPRWQRELLFAVRNLIEVILGYTYYGKRIPLDPNLSVVLI